MYIKPILHPDDFIDTTWGKNRSRKSKMMFDAVKNTNKNFKDKTVICLGGGCGRNADKLRQLGFSKVTNADINEKHLSIGKKYYKEVEHIKLDRDNPIKGYDFFFYEDIFDEAFNWHTLLNIGKWNGAGTAIMNNNAQMMVTIWERLFFEERYTATINERNPEYTELANSFGIKSMTCQYGDDIDEKII